MPSLRNEGIHMYRVQLYGRLTQTIDLTVKDTLSNRWVEYMSRTDN